MELRPNGYIINDPAELWPGFVGRDYGFNITGNQVDYVLPDFQILDVLTASSGTVVLPLHLFDDGEDYVINSDHIYKKSNGSRNGVLVSGIPNSTDGVRIKNGADGLEIHITDSEPGIKISDEKHWAGGGSVSDWSWGDVAGYLVFSYPGRSVYTEAVVNLNWMYQYCIDVVGSGGNLDLTELKSRIDSIETQLSRIKTNADKVPEMETELTLLTGQLERIISVPEGGSEGQVLTKGAEGPEWKDAPKGEGGGGGTVSVSVGSTTTVEYPEEASVKNSGNDTNVILDFKIPRGQQGERGADGDRGADGTTPDITFSASITPGAGEPAVDLQQSGSKESPEIALTFSGLQGQAGSDGETPEIRINATTDTGDVTVSKSGSGTSQNFDFAFTGLGGSGGGVDPASLNIEVSTVNKALNTSLNISDFGLTSTKRYIVYYTTCDRFAAEDTKDYYSGFFTYGSFTRGVITTYGVLTHITKTDSGNIVNTELISGSTTLKGEHYLNAVVISFPAIP